MSEKRCGNCKYFGLPEVLIDDDANEIETKWHFCVRLKHKNGRPYRFGNATFDDIAGVRDGSGYHAALVVSEDFACVLWEQAESEAGDE